MKTRSLVFTAWVVHVESDATRHLSAYVFFPGSDIQLRYMPLSDGAEITLSFHGGVSCACV